MFTIGILGAADIAYNKFIPSLDTVEGVCCGGIASKSKEKLARFEDKYKLKIYESYEDILSDSNIDAVYIPLPPAFHYEWGKKALLAGKHVLLEKPFTRNLTETEELVSLAKSKDLVVTENYMFQYHGQIEAIKEIISAGKLGKIRLIRGSFGFPRRNADDFRYIPSLGGGTMMDNGGYTIKLVTTLLGDTTKLVGSSLSYEDNGLDIFGCAEFVNDDGVLAQTAFGMDCQYQCSLEVWGSTGRLTTGRIFTAPAGFKCSAVIEDKDGRTEIELPEDDHFARSIEKFVQAHENAALREKMYKDLILQSTLSDAIISRGGNKYNG